jgi:hypothetical protein
VIAVQCLYLEWMAAFSPSATASSRQVRVAPGSGGSSVNVKLAALLRPVGACVVLPTAAAFPPGFVIAREILRKDKLAVADDEHSMKVGIGGLQLGRQCRIPVRHRGRHSPALRNVSHQQDPLPHRKWLELALARWPNTAPSPEQSRMQSASIGLAPSDVFSFSSGRRAAVALTKLNECPPILASCPGVTADAPARLAPRAIWRAEGSCPSRVKSEAHDSKPSLQANSSHLRRIVARLFCPLDGAWLSPQRPPRIELSRAPCWMLNLEWMASCSPSVTARSRCG